MVFSMNSLPENRETLEFKLRQRDREIDLLRGDLERYRRQWKEAEAKVGRLQALLDRTLGHFSRDSGAVQRLVADLSEANMRRKEQAAVIERRDIQIMALRREVASLKRGTALAVVKRWAKRAFSLRHA